MLLLEPERSPYDLAWRLFGIPVRVHPSFWIASLILGAGTWNRGPEFLVLWVLCVFVSILVHELGHVLMGQVFGTRGHILLYSFGGLAIGSNNLSKPWQRMAVSFAGPLAGFLLFGIVLLAALSTDPRTLTPLADAAIGYLTWINLVWGIVNLFPIWPLDGGQISRDFLAWLMPRQGTRVSLIISIVVAGFLAVSWGVLARDIFLALFFGMLAYSSFQAYQQLRIQRPSWDHDSTPWERDRGYGDRW